MGIAELGIQGLAKCVLSSATRATRATCVHHSHSAVGVALLTRSSSILSTHVRMIHRQRISLLSLSGQNDHRQFGHLAHQNQQNYLNPYAYTSGRWLYHDKQQLKARYIDFDFDALRQRVVQVCPGASSIESCDKIEGGFNRAFLFLLNNGKRVVAKLPFSIAGPPRLATNSEVATIKYVQSKTSIPIPDIIDWNDDPCNPIGSEYIIADHAEGVLLQQRWPAMSGPDRISFINSFCQSIREVVDLGFPSYGSLYLRGSLTGGKDFRPLDDTFCIGPHCGPMFWDCNVGESRYYHSTAPNRGPWPDLDSFCDGLIDTGVSKVPSSPKEIGTRPRYHGSPSAHLKVLESARSVIKRIAADVRVQNTAQATLFHPDLHKRNIFVAEHDPTCITSIIDWQSASIGPAFWHANETPDFAQTREHGSDTASETCAEAFEVCVQFHLPRIATPRLMDESFFRPFRYCYRTWKDGAIALQHDLIETARCWDELGLKEPCPFPTPDSAELSRNHKDYQLFVAAQDVRRLLVNLINVDTDGWIPCGEFERAKAAQLEVYEGMLKEVLSSQDPDPDDPVQVEADLKEIWPFDL